MKEQKPLYGTIPYFGGEYSIIFAKEINEHSTATSTLSGYGDFPFAKYPGLPVINYQDNDNVFECMKYPVEDLPGHGGDLQTFLNFIKSKGVEIL